MNAAVTLCGGERCALPPLLQWNIRQTDHEPCGSFSVRLLYGASMMRWLPMAVGFEAEENGKTVFSGRIDDWELLVGESGILLELNGRSPAALLLDNQVRAAEYQSAQLEDILSAYVRPYGITRIQAGTMSAVENFTVETGNSCWQVLCGFCRHSADALPHFTADGTLVLQQEPTGRCFVLSEDRLTALRYCLNRYGVTSRQIVVNTHDGSQVTADNAEFAAMGGACVHVAGTTGNKLRATWRTAQQRVTDAAGLLRRIEVELPGNFGFDPLDRVRLELPTLGIDGEWTVQEAASVGDSTGLRQSLVLR